MEADFYPHLVPNDLPERLRRFAIDLGQECADMAAMRVLDEGILMLSVDVLRTEMNSLIGDWPHLEADDFFRLKDLAEEAFLDRVRRHLTAQRETA